MQSILGFSVIVFVIFSVLSWPINLYRLTGCDFESDYKCEIMHGVGVVIPPSSFITVWFDTDE